MLLKDKVCVITGAASVRSIGYATAELFASHGARLAIIDVAMSDEALETVVSSIARHTGSAPEIMGSAYGESEKKLREIFVAAAKAAPSILFIDEIDSIAPKRGQVTGAPEERAHLPLIPAIAVVADGCLPGRRATRLHDGGVHRRPDLRVQWSAAARAAGDRGREAGRELLRVDQHQLGPPPVEH